MYVFGGKGKAHTDAIFLDFTSLQWNPVTLYRAERKVPWDLLNLMYVFGGNSMLLFNNTIICY